MTHHRLRVSAVAILGLGFMSLAAGGCLPRGEPPAGQQLLSDPTATLLTLIRAGDEADRQVLFFRPSQTLGPDYSDLWALTAHADGTASPERMLFAGIDSGLELSFRPGAGSGGGFPVDARGRIYVFSGGEGDVLRMDPATGDSVDLGKDVFPALSPSGQRVITNSTTGGCTLYEADDSSQVLDGSQCGFVGEALFYISTTCELMRVVPGGAPERVATGVSSAYTFWGPLMLIQQTMAAACDSSSFVGSTGMQALLDTTNLRQTPLPAGLQATPGSVSFDGRYLIGYRFNQTTNQGESEIFDIQTGDVENLGAGFYAGGWRPGHDEIWAATYDDSKPDLTGASLVIKSPGQPPVTVPGVYPYGFNEDGSYWFSRGTRPDQLVSSDLVGLAADPTGPRYHAVPEGSSREFFETLADGRLLVGSYTSLDDFRNTDFQIVDPRNGATITLALRGLISALGTTRLLGIFHYTFERGDLTSIDFATGHQTILAPEFAMAALADTRATDPDGYPPGGRIVYQFGARFESPWTGLWMATVP